MNDLLTQRKKTVLLGSSCASFSCVGLMLNKPFHNRGLQNVLTIVWGAILVVLVVSVIANFLKLKRMERE